MQDRVKHVLGMAKTLTDDFNCWGATKFIADTSTPTLSWVGYSDMADWLIGNYEPVRKTEVQSGDIVALFDSDKHLIHTAYCVERNQYVHKLGQNVARLETLNKVLRSYDRDLAGYIFLRRKSCV